MTFHMHLCVTERVVLSHEDKAIMEKMSFRDRKLSLLDYIKNDGKHERKVDGSLFGKKTHCEFFNCDHHPRPFRIQYPISGGKTLQKQLGLGSHCVTKIISEKEWAT